MISTLLNGFVKENPVFVLMLGLCPTLAVTTSAKNGLGMGMATTAVLLCSNIIISLIRKMVPAKIRIPIFIVVIATFVTIVDLVMAAEFPPLHKELGLFIPLIVVNCIILGRAEAFASKNAVFQSIMDGIGMGLGFTVALLAIGSVRELLGTGAVFAGFPFKIALGEWFDPAIIMILPPGAFITLGLMLGLLNMRKAQVKK